MTKNGKKKPVKYVKDVNSGYCTAPRCRKFVDPGHGIQVIDKESGTENRYCIQCYTEMCRKDDEEWEKRNSKISEQSSMPECRAGQHQE
ncbi:MAG: hypothetical protein QXU32_02025 [Nitrososphaerales archaeon]